MDDSKIENKEGSSVVDSENKGYVPTEFGIRKFVITDRTINKLINLISKIESTVGGDIQEDAILILKDLQENDYEEYKTNESNGVPTS